MGENNLSEPAHVAWFRSVEREIKEDYERLHNEALSDPQRAGHGGEGTWARILEQWLPPAYKVVTRKYIVPEVGSKSFETDIVVLHPSYPVPLHSREEILAGGVAAAFSVKLTLDAAGIRDGVERAVALRRGLQPRSGTPQDEMTGPFPVGLLAHSHTWKAPASSPAENIDNHLLALDQELVTHPRESIDYVCIADLGLWVTVRVPFMMMQAPGYGSPIKGMDRLIEEVGKTPEGESATKWLSSLSGIAASTIAHTLPTETFTTVGSFVAHLLARMSYADPMLHSLSVGFRAMGAVGTSQGSLRAWRLDSVFSEWVRQRLPTSVLQGGSDLWGSAMF
jgi:hypothetical protein